MSNINRLWAVVNKDTNEILYSSFDYNRSKCAYDRLVCPLADENGFATPNIADLWNIGFVRYDINPSYRNDDYNRVSPFQKSLNDDLRAFLDFCLLRKSGEKNNNEKKTILQKTNTENQEEK